MSLSTGTLCLTSTNSLRSSLRTAVLVSTRSSLSCRQSVVQTRLGVSSASGREGATSMPLLVPIPLRYASGVRGSAFL